ncbi:hypothetical protein SBF1_50112 [Candidatus Desulfosporosinus infrequens]|uniref:DUF559 domain-containing protein n=1 Tax=Candidatus Desulfosporosinus infrequens TaxID=2043169 RepID=A0A2U3LH62_9FIRM|nr:hypothetical protein SBF1_50112 [Candidatus Desulfosporosinus infrequens]
MSKSKAQKAITNQINFERNQEKLKVSGLINLGKKYGKIECLCPKCNNTMLVKRKLLIKNPICRNCMTGKSFGEEKAIEILTRYNAIFQKEKTFKGLKGLNGKLLRFDFYIQGELRPFLIEIDGAQHKEGDEWGGNTVAHDVLKNRYCRDNNIRLYRINYKFGKLENLEDEIMKVLRVQGVA